MINTTSEDLIQSLQWRYATKVFDAAKTIPDDIWQAIEHSMVLTPSSFGLQPWKFVTVTCPKTKAELLEHSWNQTQVTDCSHMVVMCAKENMDEADIEAWLTQLMETRNVTRESLDGYAGMMSGFFGNMDASQTQAWAKNQVYIALGQLMTTAAALKIDACPMEGIVPTEYDRILGLESSGYATAVGCAMGYRSVDDKYSELPKVRFASDKILKTI